MSQCTNGESLYVPSKLKSMTKRLSGSLVPKCSESERIERLTKHHHRLSSFNLLELEKNDSSKIF